MGKTDTLQVPEFTTESPDYEVDYYAWSQEQARRIRMLQIPGVDIEILDVNFLPGDPGHELP